MRDLSVVIPNFNGRRLLENLLPALREQTAPPAEVVVADDGSEDDSRQVAARLGARVVALGRNVGFAAAVNCGVREVRTSWVAVLNNDVTPAPDYLERLLAGAERTRAWFAVGKLLRRDEPGILDGSYDALCRGACSWRVGWGRRDGPQWNQPRSILLAPFTAVLLRRELFDRIGYLEESFQAYLEDVEFSLRAALGGFRGVYVPEATGQHVGGATLGRWHPRAVRLVARNQLLLVARHYPPDWRRRYGRAVAAAQLLWGLVAARHGRLRAYCAGKSEGWRLLRQAEAGARPLADPGLLEAVLTESEAEIRRVQAETGWDWYWRLYFLLAGG